MQFSNHRVLDMVGDHHCFFPLFFFGSYDDVQKLATRKEPKKKKKGKETRQQFVKVSFFSFFHIWQCS